MSTRATHSFQTRLTPLEIEIGVDSSANTSSAVRWALWRPGKYRNWHRFKKVGPKNKKR